MVEAFGAVQSADAIVSLISFTKRTIEYCIKLARAEKGAQRILERIQNFRDVIEGPIVLLKSHPPSHVDRVQLAERLRLLGHIDTAVRGCLQTLRSIDGILAGLLEADMSGLRKINASRVFVGQANEIHDLLNQLDGQKITLLIAFAAIGLYNQQNPLPHERNTDTCIQQLTININYGREFLQSSLNRPRPPELTGIPLPLDEPSGNRQTFEEDLLSVRCLAEDVLGRLRSPSTPRRDSFAAQALLAEESNTFERSAFTTASPPLSGVEGTAIDDGEDDLRYTGIATGQKICPVNDVDMLQSFIEKCRRSARQSVEGSRYVQAEQHLERAFAYSEQRERLQDGIPFVDRVALLEELAGVCRKLCNWTAAIKILELLLSGHALPDQDSDHSINGTVVRSARHYQLLAATLFDKCCMIFDESDMARSDAYTNANHAWSLWKSIQKFRTLTSEEQRSRSECAVLLRRIWTIYGGIEEASYFTEESLCQYPPSPITIGSPTTVADFISFTAHRPSVLVHPDDHRSRLDDYEAAKNAVMTSHAFILHRLFGSSDSPLAIDDKFTNGQTILHYAATQRGASKMVQEILRLGADVNVQDDLQETALVKAIKGDHHETVAALLQWQDGALDMNTRLPNGQSLLHFSVQHGALQSIRRLLRKRPDIIHLKDRDGQTPLHQCAKDGNAETAKVLLDLEADFMSEDTRHRRPGYYTLLTCDKGHQDVFQLLMERSAREIIGATESTLVDSIVDRHSLTRRQSETLITYLKTFRKHRKMTVRAASEPSISSGSMEETYPATKTNTNTSTSKPKRSFLKRWND